MSYCISSLKLKCIFSGEGNKRSVFVGCKFLMGYLNVRRPSRKDDRQNPNSPARMRFPGQSHKPHTHVYCCNDYLNVKPRANAALGHQLLRSAILRCEHIGLFLLARHARPPPKKEKDFFFNDRWSETNRLLTLLLEGDLVATLKIMDNNISSCVLLHFDPKNEGTRG